MTIKDIVKQNEENENSIEVPFHVWTCFCENEPSVGIASDQVRMGNSDYKSVNEHRQAIDWLAEQFGGKVKWSMK